MPQRLRKESLVRRLFVVILFLWPVLATVNPAVADYPEEARCFFWEVEAETGTSYLLGSIHLGTEDLFPLPAKIEEAFEKSSFLVVEANILAVDEEELRSLMNSFAVNPGLQSIEQYISPEEYDMLLAVLAEFELDIGQVSFFRPWFLAQMISSLRFLKAGFNPNLGIDLHFLQKASGKKDILELESPNSSLGSLVNSLPNWNAFICGIPLPPAWRDLKKNSVSCLKPGRQGIPFTRGNFIFRRRKRRCLLRA